MHPFTPYYKLAHHIDPSESSVSPASGKLKEAFACGTAAVISPIGKVCSASGAFL